MFFETNISCLEPCLNIIGLLFDIVGAWFVAYEVVNQYKGSQFKESHSIVFDMIAVNQVPAETEEYQRWLNKRNRYMWIGFGFLTTGFIIQILANLIS